MALEAGHADPGDQARPRLHRLLHQLAHRRPARRRRGRQGPQGRVHASTRWSSPARSRSPQQAEAEGLDEVFRAAGFDWRSAGCSMCLGMNPDILRQGERCASTSNRNFEGRQGRGGRTHLVSPQMAAAAAIEGHFVDIREWELSMERRHRPSPARSACSTAPTSTPTRSSPSSSSSGSSAPASASSSSTTGPRSPAGTCPRNPILATGPNFGCGSSPRARAVGAAGLRLPGGRRAELRRHLLLQLHEDRPAAGASSTPRACAR